MNFLKKIFPITSDGKINVFGFNFYEDDLLILAILFFLFWQKCNDKMLYIILLMLLIDN